MLLQNILIQKDNHHIYKKIKNIFKRKIVPLKAKCASSWQKNKCWNKAPGNTIKIIILII